MSEADNKAEAPPKATPGGDDDCSKGPAGANRGIPCIGRDPLWCLIFIAHIAVFVYMALEAQALGDYRRMVNGQDFMGNVCGANGKPSQFGARLENYPYVYYSLNITTVMQKMADGMGLQPGGAQGNFLESAEMLQGDPGAAMLQLLGGGDTETFPASLINQLATYFHPVCVQSCTIGMYPKINDEGVEQMKYYENYTFRTAFWPGYPQWEADSWQKQAWDALFTNDPTPALLAYNTSDCPYPAALCVPLNSMMENMQMTNIDIPGNPGAGFCVPTVESAQALADGIASASEDAAAVIPQDFAERSQDFVGSMVADLVTAQWTFVVMAFVGLVIGVVYLVLMRYIVGPLVWISLIGVAVILFTMAGLLYLQSIKCAVPPSATGGGGGGANGTSASNSTTTAATTSGGRLLFDFEDEFEARALSESTSTFGECPSTCPSGCEVGDKTARQACQVGAAIIVGLGAFYLFCLCCNYGRIQLAIALNKVAARFVAQQPYSLIVPPIQIVVVFMYLLLWIVLTVMIVSYVPDYFQVDQGNFTYEEAVGIQATSWLSSGVAGKCWENSDRVDQGVYQVTVEDPVCGGRTLMNTTAGFESEPVYRCVLMAYVGGQDYRFWYAFFSLLWINAFMIAFGQTAIAGAVAKWYFSPNDQKLNPTPIPWGIKTTLTYHMGSVAFGSFIIALIQLLKYYLMYLSKQAEKQHNKILALIFSCLAYAVWCFEKCAKFLSKNAYIQIALLGKKFCYAAKDAFWLIFRNMGRIAAAAMISPVINYLGFLIITLSTVLIGFLLIQALGLKLNSPYGACTIYLIEGWVCGKLVMNVFGLGVDTVLQCFVADEEINGTVGEHTPYELTNFLAENKEGLDKVSGTTRA